MLNGRRVAVVGAGIGGLAAAIALRLRGADVHVLERVPELHEVGAGIQISHNGFVVLDALGLGAAARGKGIRAEAVELFDYRRRRRVLRLDLARHAEGQTFLFMHRADLLALLVARARACGVRISLGSGAASGHEVDAAAFAAPADLVVAADGLHSVFRAQINGPAEAFFTGQVAWRAIVPTECALPARARIFMAPGRHLVTYPIRGGAWQNIVAVQETAHWASEGWAHSDDPAHLRAAFADFGAPAQQLLARVAECGKWGLFRHPVATRWHHGRFALVGDAAHPTLPFLAQGANLALEDGFVLAACLAWHGDQAAALAAYQSARRNRAERVIAAANANAWKYHVRFVPARLLGHTALRVAGALAPARMVRGFDWLYGHDVTAEPPGG